MTYHMRRPDRQITGDAEIDSIIQAGAFAVCALCQDGEPYVVTLSYGYDPESRTLYFHSAHVGQKLDFIRANPSACLTIIDDLGYIRGECSHAYRSAIVRGRFEFIENEAERAEAMRTMISHYEEPVSPLMAKIDTGSEAWKRTQMLKLTIESVTAKSRPIRR